MTATTQPETKSPSRRALLAGALGGIGALAATVIGRASPVRAANGDPVLVGNAHTATAETKITNSTTIDTVLWGASSSGVGVSGTSSSNFGVYGSSTSYTGILGSSSTGIGVVGGSQATNQAGVLGRSFGSSTGVYGASEGGSLPAAKAKTGVYGYAAQDSSSTGVYGESPAGRAVVGLSSSGYAGYFNGRVYTTKWYELTEVSTPAAPVANRARLFVRDSGGKTQLCVRFPTGAVKILATEP